MFQIVKLLERKKKYIYITAPSSSPFVNVILGKIATELPKCLKLDFSFFSLFLVGEDVLPNIPDCRTVKYFNN